jgi:hypothetical protein
VVGVSLDASASTSCVQTGAGVSWKVQSAELLLVLSSAVGNVDWHRSGFLPGVLVVCMGDLRESLMVGSLSSGMMYVGKAMGCC